MADKKAVETQNDRYRHLTAFIERAFFALKNDLHLAVAEWDCGDDPAVPRDVKENHVEATRQAELLIFLLLLLPKSLVDRGSPEEWKEWSEYALDQILDAPRSDDVQEVPHLFAQLVAYLKEDFGMHTVAGAQLSFQLSRDFIRRATPPVDLIAQRSVLLARLRAVEEKMQLPVERRTNLFRQSATAPTPSDIVGRSRSLSDLRDFLSSPGPDAVDDQTFAKLLARNTGA